MAKSMVGEDSIKAAADCVARQQKGDTDHARAHGARKGMDRDMGDADLAKVRKL